MEYIRTEASGQLVFEKTTDYLCIPSCLYGFKNERTTTETAQSGRRVICFRGTLAIEEEDRMCKCGTRMHINAHSDITLRHLCFGGNLSCVLFPHNRFKSTVVITTEPGDVIDYLLDGEMNLSAFCIGEKVIRNVRTLRDGDTVSLRDGSCRLRVIHTPGHTTDSVVYYSEKDRIAFVGDTIFKGSVGNWQYPGGNRQTLVESITERIFAMPDDTVLCSGHSEATTVGIEKRRYQVKNY